MHDTLMLSENLLAYVFDGRRIKSYALVKVVRKHFALCICLHGKFPYLLLAGEDLLWVILQTLCDVVAILAIFRNPFL